MPDTADVKSLKTEVPAGRLTRRALLTGLAAGILPAGACAGAQVRVAAIDWAMLETAMALGVTPVAMTERINFRKDAVQPAIPDEVIDLGLRGSPNFELLHLLKPDLILSSPFYRRHLASLEDIAPVFSQPFYVRGEPPFEKALSALAELGDRLGRPERGRLERQKALSGLEEKRDALAAFAGRPTYVVNIGDASHFRAFGGDSMFGDILARLGLPNAWPERTRFGFMAPVPLEKLADMPDARIVIVSEIPPESRRSLQRSVMWNAVPAVRRGRVLQLDNVNPYGGVTAGLRFASLLHDGLLGSGGNL